MGTAVVAKSHSPGRPWQQENLGRGEAQQIGVPNKSHSSADLSGPCSSWGKKQSKNPPYTRNSALPTPGQCHPSPDSFLISDGGLPTWHHDLAISWQEFARTGGDVFLMGAEGSPKGSSLRGHGRDVKVNLIPHIFGSRTPGSSRQADKIRCGAAKAKEDQKKKLREGSFACERGPSMQANQA